MSAFSDHFARTDAPTWHDVVEGDAHRATVVLHVPLPPAIAAAQAEAGGDALLVSIDPAHSHLHPNPPRSRTHHPHTTRTHTSTVTTHQDAPHRHNTSITHHQPALMYFSSHISLTLRTFSPLCTYSRYHQWSLSTHFKGTRERLKTARRVRSAELP
jgi:hypothetical protein